MTRKDYILLADALKAAAYALNPPERNGALLAAYEIMHIAALSFFWGVLLLSILVIRHTIKN